MKESGQTTNLTDMEHTLILMVRDTKATGLKTCRTVLAKKAGTMEPHIKVTTRKARRMAKGNSFLLTAVSMKARLKMIKSKE